MMFSSETRYTMALTRMTGFNHATALLLYRQLGSAQALYEQRNNLGDVLPDSMPRLRKALADWDDALRRTDTELAYMQQHHIDVLTLNDDRYPARLRECPDAPLALYYRGTADLNQRYVVDIVGTRHMTPYGQDLVTRLMADLRQLLPQVLIVSGLAYGVDICAHRNALSQGYETVAVLAHGLDQIYPARHEQTARQMEQHGGLLTEYMSQSFIDKANFVRRNRIVAGLSDATILVESAARGGGLITCEIARSYNRDVFAFPGAVGMPYSEGCNKAIRHSTAALITSAADLLDAMGWQQPAKARAVERQLFPDLTADEQRIADLLARSNDLQLNVISVQTGLPVQQAAATLFTLEMKGLVRAMAGGSYHLVR